MAAHSEIFAASVDLDYARMGTTIVALVLNNRSYKIAWIGDSRAYKIGNTIDALTKDHNVAQELLDQGAISRVEAAKHPGRNRLTRALGINECTSATIGTVEGEIDKQSKLLLCSDGLHGLVTDRQIQNVVLGTKNLQKAADNLVDNALKAGGSDNVSVILVSVGAQ